VTVHRRSVNVTTILTRYRTCHRPSPLTPVQAGEGALGARHAGERVQGPRRNAFGVTPPIIGRVAATDATMSRALDPDCVGYGGP